MVFEALDVKAAFLDGYINKFVLLSHPYKLLLHMQRAMYYVFQKSIYGFWQAPVHWFIKLRDAFVNNLSFKQLNSDGSLFFNTTHWKKDIHL